MAERPTYIVTGGAGFIGSNLVAALLGRTERPHVIVVDNFRTGSFANIVEACARAGVGAFDGEVVPASAAEVDWKEMLGRLSIDAVFHLGAITDTTIADETLMLRENVGGFASMLGACGAQPCDIPPVPLVYASSAATYGSPARAHDRVPFPEDAAGSPCNIYGFSKWLMEREHLRFAAAERPSYMDEKLPPPRVIGLRYFNVFGPGEARKGRMASMVYQLTRQMLAGKPPRVFRDGSQARDQVFVDDVVDCTLAAAGLGARPDPASGVYNLGSGKATSFNQIIGAIRQALEIPETKRPTEYFDMPPDVRAFYQDYTCADMGAARAGLGWTPRHDPIEAVKRYALWLKENV